MMKEGESIRAESVGSAERIRRAEGRVENAGGLGGRTSTQLRSRDGR